MKREQLTSYLEEYLDASSYDDYCPNGLQVEGASEVNKIALGVTASAEMIRRSIAIGADTILVHHGIIWKGARPTYTGGYRERVRLLLANDLNLYGFHLPLDAHLDVGNNVSLARKIGLTDLEPFGRYNGRMIGIKARAGGIGVEELSARLLTALDREPLAFGGGPELIESVGIITGGAQGSVTEAIQEGLDAYITGEVSESSYHVAMEEGIHFIAAGHHATETWGVQALCAHLAERFGVDVEFVDVPNPV